MRRCLGLLLLILINGGCSSRPCCYPTLPTLVCRAEGSTPDDWRIATSVCRDLEATGAQVSRVFVDGCHLSVTFTPDFGRQLLLDEPSLRQNLAAFMSVMRSETGANTVSVDFLSGDVRIASGVTTELGEDQIIILG